MLSALRAKRGWPRVIALALLFAFTAGLAHVHPLTVAADAVSVAVDHGDLGPDHGDHDHDGKVPSASSDCGFCAAVAGKLFLPPPVRTEARLMVATVSPLLPARRLISSSGSDLFRPPIAAVG